jgi:hypothetical protein
MMEDIKTMIDRLQPQQRIEFALSCARRVQHLMTDPRSVAALDTGERWLRGEATNEEMAAAAEAAWEAAYSAVWAGDGWDAARTASWAAEAAADAAQAADAAAGAAGAAAWAVEGDAERAWQRKELHRMLEGGGA